MSQKPSTPELSIKGKMTSDALTKAKELIERFKNKITQGEWDVGATTERYHTSIEVLDRFSNESILGTEIDIALMSCAPTMLKLIEELVERVKSAQHRAILAENKLHRSIFGDLVMKLEQENQSLKQRIAELEGGE